MKVRCINNDDTECLELNKIYSVKIEEPYIYNLEELPGNIFDKDRFEVVDDIGKFYTMKEVIISIKEGEEYVCTDLGYNVQSIYREQETIFLRYLQEHPEDGLGISLSAKFKLLKKDKERIEKEKIYAVVGKEHYGYRMLRAFMHKEDAERYKEKKTLALDHNRKQVNWFESFSVEEIEVDI